MYYHLLRKALFQLDPESAQDLVLRQLKYIVGTPLKVLIHQKVPEKSVTCMGLTFRNPLGLAAGLDKNGECINALSILGFGFIEVGTVTPLPQSGNDKPRLFRLPEAEGLINRMGFNNYGIDYLVENIKKTHFPGILGVNIGKNKNTVFEHSKDDYIICMRKVYNYADYIAINISSPNTPKLRMLQYGEIFDDLLATIKNQQSILYNTYFKYVPIVIKIAPDLSDEEIAKIADGLVRHNIDGVIATNTTIDRSLVHGMNHCNEIGGLSGRPLQLKSTEIIRRLARELNGKLPIIGVGGIDSVIAAREKIAAGTTLVQIYSAFIYRGPFIIKEIITYI